MGRSSNAFIAATQGASFTLYAAMRALGIPLSREQEEFQTYLERTYPTAVSKEEQDEGNQG